MQWNRFSGSVFFAALAAAGFPAARFLLDPVLGSLFATQFYLVGSAVLYTLCMARSMRRGVAGASFVGLLGAASMFATPYPSDLALALTTGIAIARSAPLFRTQLARALAIEVVLGVSALLVASWFSSGSANAFASGSAAPSLLSGALALWNYFLVQSLYQPLSRALPRRPLHSADAFDEASARLQRLLRETES